MPEVVNEPIVEDILTFAKKHTPTGLVACGKHSRPVSPLADESVVQLEIPGGFSPGPICTRHCVATVFYGEIYVRDNAWRYEIEELARKYEEYSGKQVRVTILEWRPS